MATITEQLRALQLSASEIAEFTGWPSYMIEDYLNLISATLTLAENADNTNIDTTNIEELLSDAIINIQKGMTMTKKVDDKVDIALALTQIEIQTNKLKSSITTLNKRLDNIEQTIL